MRPKVYTWTAPNNAAVTAAGAYAIGILPLNGTLYNPQVGTTIKFPGYSRTVSVTSNANIAAANFTIRGTYNSFPVQDTVTGVNNNTVQGANSQFFDEITSVTVDAVVANASVGTGQVGHTSWYLADYDKIISNFYFQTIVTGTINYSLQATLMDVTTSNTPFAPGNIVFFDPTASMTGLTANSSNSHEMTPLRYITFRINSSTNGTLTAIILENG